MNNSAFIEMRKSMNVWLCPVKPRNWRIIKSTKLFGVPKRGLKTFRRVEPGDLLVFHVFKPINGIVAMCKVKSNVFEDYEDIWGRDRYPFRVKVEFIPELTRNEDEPIPLCSFLGRIDDEKGIRIEPYLKNQWITHVSDKQYETLKKLFGKQEKQNMNPSNVK